MEQGRRASPPPDVAALHPGYELCIIEARRRYLRNKNKALKRTTGQCFPATRRIFRQCLRTLLDQALA
jgi:hypothetical protein